MKRVTNIMACSLCMLLLAAAVSYAGDTLLDRVQQEVKLNLIKSISAKVELEELKVLRGTEYFGAGGSEMQIQNIYMDGYSGRNKVIYAVYLRDRHAKVVSAVVEASYDIFEDVYVTARHLSKGEVLTKGDYYSVRQKLSRMPGGAITDRNELDGKIIKTSVSDGVILKQTYLASANIVKKGRKVDLLIEGSNVVVSAKATLRNDSTVGATAHAYCDMTRKEVQGVLVSPSLLRVKI